MESQENSVDEFKGMTMSKDKNESAQKAVVVGVGHTNMNREHYRKESKENCLAMKKSQEVLSSVYSMNNMQSIS